MLCFHFCLSLLSSSSFWIPSPNEAHRRVLHGLWYCFCAPSAYSFCCSCRLRASCLPLIDRDSLPLPLRTRGPRPSWDPTQLATPVTFSPSTTAEVGKLTLVSTVIRQETECTQIVRRFKNWFVLVVQRRLRLPFLALHNSRSNLVPLPPSRCRPTQAAETPLYKLRNPTKMS